MHQGKRLKSLIDKDSRTMKEIAESLNITRETLWGWTKKESIPEKDVERLKEQNIDIGIGSKASDTPVSYTIHRGDNDKRKGLRATFRIDTPKESIVTPIYIAQKANNKGIPYLNGDVLAGKIDLIKEPEREYVKEYYIIPNIKADLMIDVTGDSMYPTYKRGDRILLSNRPDFELIEIGQPHVIITSDDNRVLKRIYKATKAGYWSLVSDNDSLGSDNNKKYPPYDIPISKVAKVFIVKGIMRSE